MIRTHVGFECTACMLGSSSVPRSALGLHPCLHGLLWLLPLCKTVASIGLWIGAKSSHHTSVTNGLPCQKEVILELKEAACSGFSPGIKVMGQSIWLVFPNVMVTPWQKGSVLDALMVRYIFDSLIPRPISAILPF